jgi:hypothetical protein
MSYAMSMLAELWGGPPGPRPAPRPASRLEEGITSSIEQRDEGVPRGPGGPPHNLQRRPEVPGPRTRQMFAVGGAA